MFSREKNELKRVPMMPVRDMVIFPQMMQPFIVGREASVRALEEALAGDKKIFLATQHDASVDDPKPEEIFPVGTLANIVQSVKLPDGNIRVLVEGVERAKVVAGRQRRRLLPRHAASWCRCAPSLRRRSSRPSRRVNGLFEQYVKLSQSLNYDTMIAAARVEDPGQAFRHHRRQSADSRRGKAGAAREFRCARPPEPRRAKSSKAKSKSSTWTATSIPA